MIGSKHFFTLAEVAQLRDLSVKSVLAAIHAGQLGAYRYGPRCMIVERPDLESWRTPVSRPPAAVPVALPRRERYSPKDLACEFSIPLKVVRRAIARGQLAFSPVNARVVEIYAAAVRAWRAECRQFATVPVARGTSRTGTTFPKRHKSALSAQPPRALIAA